MDNLYKIDDSLYGNRAFIEEIDKAICDEVHRLAEEYLKEHGLMFLTRRKRHLLQFNCI